MNTLQEPASPPPCYQWQAPPSYMAWQSDTELNNWKKKFARTLLLVAAIEILFYVLMHRLPLKEIGFNLTKSLVMLFLGIIGMSAYAYLIGPYFFRFSKIIYTINDKGITKVSSSKKHLYAWKNITYLGPLENHDTLSDVLSLQFYTKKMPHFPRALLFDPAQPDLAQEIHQYLQSQITDPAAKPPEFQPRLQPTLYEHAYIIAFCLAVVLTAIYLILKPFHPSEALKSILIVAPIVLGPGTWALLLLYCKKLFKYPDWPIWAMAYNFITMMMAMLIILVIEILKVSKTFQQTP